MTQDGFENGNYTVDPTWVSSGTSTPAVNAGAAKEGSYGLNCDDVDGKYVILVTTLGAAVSTLDTWTWIRTTNVAGGYATYEFQNAAGGRSGNVGINGSKFQYLDNSGYNDFTATPSNDTWYIFRIRYDGTLIHFYIYDDALDLIEEQLDKTPDNVADQQKTALFVQNNTGEVHFDDVGYEDEDAPAAVVGQYMEAKKYW